MPVRLTKEILSTFIENAQKRNRETLTRSGSLTPLVFANTSLLWFIPPEVNHPLRRVLGLTTPFILLSATKTITTEENEDILMLRTSRGVVSGAAPLTEWDSLASSSDNLCAISKYEYEWSVQKLEPLDRDKARVLAAEYAQILPELERDENNDGEKLALPMLAFTKEISQLGTRPPFYLVVFRPGSAKMFANVVAVKEHGRLQTHDAESTVVEIDQISDGNAHQRQHWAEYELLGSPSHTDDPDNVSSLDAIIKRSGCHRGADDDAVSFSGSDEALSSIDSLDESTSTSYTVLHGVWSSEVRSGSFTAQFPPVPPPSTQWIIELLSMPLAREADPNTPLMALYMEIKRLETWCICWAAGSKWISTQDMAESGRNNLNGFVLHPWQIASRNSGGRRDYGENTETIDEACMENRTSGTDGTTTELENHRRVFGQKIDEFIDKAIDETRGNNGIEQCERVKMNDTLEEFSVRKDLDFTEKLWALAHHAYDESDLSEIMAAVAEGLETQRLQPFINDGNQSPLALVIRQALLIAQAQTLVDEEAERERLSGQLDTWIDERPLEPFVNIGLYKLRTDLWTHFVGARLATTRQMEPFLDESMGPIQMISRFWLLLRVLEVWWLVRQAAPGLPRQHSCQVIDSLLELFAAALPAIDRQDNRDVVDGSVDCRMPRYEDCLRVSLFLPVYSGEVQSFAAAVAKGFEPTRCTITATDIKSDSAANQTAGHRSKYSLLHFAKTPALIDQHFANDNMQLDTLLDNVSDATGTDEGYTIFEARHI
ncbi:hypothetical protein COEREDRAFT_6514 [Coemansia reversa NRRL 1564]|uniref:Uncharacterized protein n=1 Tax=Coemansia reversa (strain ATCC 12441 / NRRL 1564) TaxID=763665 RepID=A0A2G5BGW7_COERN|nr:hypothetical protein COEREDRAFT_6514 [Coemansia reversa NRRL 1564]|eukprot:PIA18268.1 hypothetical protein COEREDRAFT_6514 [Coemansia reversa NRRL 1564]